jgi:hypothetical protein
MAVDTSPNPRSMRKSAAGKSAAGKSPAAAQRTGAADQRSPGVGLIDAERRRALIAEAAYFRAERRGFSPGHEAEDWLAAETEIDRTLAIGVSPALNPGVQ